MTCVPVIIPTLCRYEHFKRCVESLLKNRLAEKTELFIGLDYPAKESHWEGYRKIKAYIDNGITGFLRVNVIKHEENVGSRKNVLILRETVYERFDCYIYTEDDNEFAPSFLEYMNICMKKYERDEQILAVSGYSYPFDKEGMDGDFYMLDCYYSALGCGMWKHKQSLMFQEITMELFEQNFNDPILMRKLRKKSFNQFTNLVKGMIGYTSDLIRNDKIITCDLSYGLYMFFKDKKMIFPKTTLVRNWGYDGSGENCNKVLMRNSVKSTYREYDFSTQKLNECQEWGKDLELSGLSEKEIDRRLQKFFEIPGIEKIKVLFVYCLTQILGRKRVMKFLKIKC